MFRGSLFKGAIAVAIIILVIVASLSFFMKDKGKDVFYADSEWKHVLQEINIDRRLLSMTSFEGKMSVYDNLPGTKNRTILQCLGEKAIVIKKIESKKDTMSLELFDDAINQKLELSIKGIDVGKVSLEYIYRIVANNIYQGNPVEERDFVKVIDISEESQYGYETPKVHITMELNTNYAYNLYEDESYYYISLLRPKDVYDKIIVLDAGHGGIDCGALALAKDYYEKDINLSILLYLLKLLEQEDDIKVYATRVEDTSLTLNQRVALANQVDADLFLSIHCNSSEDSSIHGLEVLYNEKQTNRMEFRSRDFAELCLLEVGDRVKLSNRGIVPRSKNVHIIGNATMPVALVEVAFMSNSGDLNFLIQAENQKKVAQGLYHAILDSFSLIN